MTRYDTSVLLQGRNDSGSGTDPPSGALPQLVTPEGGAERSNHPGPDTGGRAQQGDRGGMPGPSEGKPGGKAAPADSNETSASVADLAVPARPAAPVPPLGTSVPGMLQTFRLYRNASVCHVLLCTMEAEPSKIEGMFALCLTGDWSGAPGKWPHTQNEEESLCKSFAAGACASKGQRNLHVAATSN